MHCLQVLRVLMTIMSDFATAPLGQRPPPFALEGEGTLDTLVLMQQGVAALQVRGLLGLLW
jgi:hypothetical protein